MDPEEEALEEPTSPEAEEQKRREKAFAEWLRAVQPRMFPALIAVCVAIFLLTEWAGGSMRGDVLVRFGALSGPLLELGEWWRIFASGFLHIGWIHLIANMWAVYALGTFLERFYGPWRLLALFTFAVLGGALGGVLVNPLATMAGASGGIFGWFGAIVVIYFKYRDKFSDRWRPVRWWISQVLLLNIILALFIPALSHGAHIGGFAFGMLFAVLLPSRPGFVETPRPWTRFLPAISLILVPSLGWAMMNATSDPWESGWKHYKGEKFEIDYPETFGQTEAEFHSQSGLVTDIDKAASKNIVFIGLGVQVHVGTLTREEQAAFEEAKSTYVVVLPDYNLKLSKIDALSIRGESWTRYAGRIDQDVLVGVERVPVHAYVHEATQWHVIAYGSTGVPIEPFESGLRKMVDSFRLNNER